MKGDITMDEHRIPERGREIIDSLSGRHSHDQIIEIEEYPKQIDDLLDNEKECNQGTMRARPIMARIPYGMDVIR
jgi:hypothetical protein